MDNYQFRLVTMQDKSDIENICSFEYQCPQGHGDLLHCVLQRPERPRMSRFPNAFAILAETKGETKRLVGNCFGHLRLVQFEKGRFDWISWCGGLRVHPEHRGSGIGSHLVNLFNKEAKSRGAVFNYVDVFNSIKSLGLFQRLGYVYLWHPFNYYSLDVVKAAGTIAKNCVNHNEIVLTVLENDGADSFLINKFSNALFFPDLCKTPVGARVYLATFKETPYYFAAAAMSQDNLLQYIKVPDGVIMPIATDKPWTIRWFLPFAYNVGNQSNRTDVFRRLVHCCLGYLVRDMAKMGVNVLRYSPDELISGISGADSDVVQDFLSPAVFQSSNFQYLIKYLGDDVKNSQLLLDRLNEQNFVFIDGKEI